MRRFAQGTRGVDHRSSQPGQLAVSLVSRALDAFGCAAPPEPFHHRVTLVSLGAEQAFPNICELSVIGSGSVRLDAEHPEQMWFSAKPDSPVANGTGSRTHGECEGTVGLDSCAVSPDVRIPVVALQLAQRRGSMHGSPGNERRQHLEPHRYQSSIHCRYPLNLPSRNGMTSRPLRRCLCTPRRFGTATEWGWNMRSQRQQRTGHGLLRLILPAIICGGPESAGCCSSFGLNTPV